MSAHPNPNPAWWERHDRLMWTLATAVEHWQWALGIALLVLFTLTSSGGA